MNAPVSSVARAVFEAYSRHSGNPPDCHRDRDAAEQWMTQALEEVGIADLIIKAIDPHTRYSELCAALSKVKG